MKNQIENPNGLHQRYSIRKIKAVATFEADKNSPYGKRKVNGIKYKEVDVDEDSEYFVLRLDTGGSDMEHIKAGRIANLKKASIS